MLTRASRAELSEAIEVYGDKPVSDGVTVDTSGNVYITDLEGKAIEVTRPNGAYEALLNDERLEWPDGFAYVTVNQLPRSPFLNKGRDTAAPPFYIFRFEPLGHTPSWVDNAAPRRIMASGEYRLRPPPIHETKETQACNPYPRTAHSHPHRVSPP